MERFTRLFESLLVFVYHCFDRIVIHGYLSGLSRMARKSDSCLTPCIKGERRLHETPILRRSDSVKLGDLQAGRSFRIVPGASDVEGACARASLPHWAGE